MLEHIENLVGKYEEDLIMLNSVYSQATSSALKTLILARIIAYTDVINHLKNITNDFEDTSYSE